jgi:hypothetical protein
MVVGDHGPVPPFVLNGEQIAFVQDFQFLGLPVQDDGKWDRTVNWIAKQADTAFDSLGWMMRCRELPVTCRAALWAGKVRPRLDYGLECVTPSDAQLNELEKVQRRHMRAILGCSSRTPNGALYGELDFPTVKQRIAQARSALLSKLEQQEAGSPPRRVFAQFEGTPRSLSAALAAERDVVVDKAAEFQALARKTPSLDRYRNLKGTPAREPYLSGDARQAALLFKIRSGTIPVARYLMKIGRLDSDACLACGQHEAREDLAHCLLHCHATRRERVILSGLFPGWDELSEEDRLRLIYSSGGAEDEAKRTALSALWKARCEAFHSARLQTPLQSRWPTTGRLSTLTHSQEPNGQRAPPPITNPFPGTEPPVVPGGNETQNLRPY